MWMEDRSSSMRVDRILLVCVRLSEMDYGYELPSRREHLRQMRRECLFVSWSRKKFKFDKKRYRYFDRTIKSRIIWSLGHTIPVLRDVLTCSIRVCFCTIEVDLVTHIRTRCRQKVRIDREYTFWVKERVNTHTRIWDFEEISTELTVMIRASVSLMGSLWVGT